MTIAFVQHAAGSSATPPPSVAFGGAVVSSHWLIAVVFLGANATVTVSDSVNGAYAALGSPFFDATNNVYLAAFGVKTAAGTPTVSVAGAGGIFGGLDVYEFSGFVGTPTVDLTATTGFTGSSTTPTAAAATNFSTELLLASVWNGGGTGNLSGTVSGWTLCNGGGPTGRGWFVVNAAAGSAPFAGSLTTTNPWDVFVVGVYDASAASTPFMGQICW